MRGSKQPATSQSQETQGWPTSRTSAALIKHARLLSPESSDSAQYLSSHAGRPDAALHRSANNDKSFPKATEMLRFTRSERHRTGIRDSSGPGLSGGLSRGVFSAVAFGCKDAFHCLVLKGTVQRRCCPFRGRRCQCC